jgi:hypothetical protein
VDCVSRDITLARLPPHSQQQTKHGAMLAGMESSSTMMVKSWRQPTARYPGDETPGTGQAK